MGLKNLFAFGCPDDNLTPLSPLQPGAFSNPFIILSGEGNLAERGLRPLSNFLPLSNIIKNEHSK
jgi:hypothetical protein